MLFILPKDIRDFGTMDLRGGYHSFRIKDFTYLTVFEQS